jgi:hypothetical protein
VACTWLWHTVTLSSRSLLDLPLQTHSAHSAAEINFCFVIQRNLPSNTVKNVKVPAICLRQPAVARKAVNTKCCQVLWSLKKHDSTDSVSDFNAGPTGSLMVSSARRALYAFPCEDVPRFYSQFVLCTQSIVTDFKRNIRRVC